MKAIIFDTENNIAGIVPDSAIEPARNPFFIPEIGEQWTVTPLTGVCINRLGKCVAERFTDRYFANVLSAVHPSNGKSEPVEWSRDGALLVSATSPKTDYPALTESMKPLVAAASASMTLKTGDIILRIAASPRAVVDGDTETVEIPDAPPASYKIR